MLQLGIEKCLKKAGERERLPFYEKYAVLKDRLFTREYSFWAMKFSGGNDHGPQHISRVLEKLDFLLGENPVERRFIGAYELFLTMMSILYHDVGILRERKEHPNIGGDFVEQEKNHYLFDLHDRDIIRAAVVSHGSQKDIDLECRGFSQTEAVGRHTVRPRMIAALVRLADELDEDYRRADPIVAEHIQLPDSSQFFWQFCQRITGIQPNQQSHEIYINVKLEVVDIGRTVSLEGKSRSFLAAFGDKIAKINRERVLLNKFLPKNLQYNYIKVSIRPLDKHDIWKFPRPFVFGDHTSASEFVAAYPELLIEPAHKNLQKALEFIRTEQLKDALVELRELERISEDLPIDLHLRVLYDVACVESRLAEKSPLRSSECKRALDYALEYLGRWLELGNSGGWEKMGQTSQNEIYKMSKDNDLHYVVSHRKSKFEKMIPAGLQSALPWKSSSGGGCVPAGTVIWTPKGFVPIEDLQEDAEVFSIDIEGKHNPIVTRITSVHISNQTRCICLNGRYVVTPTQPLYEAQGKWILADDLIPGMRILNYKLEYETIDHLEQIGGYFEVYNLSTDHPSHNYVAGELICHNKEK